MTDRSPRDIEREIEAERNALERSINQLQAQFSPEMIVEQASRFIKANGGELAESVGRTVRENPMAAALAGAGIAWLIAGAQKSGGSELSPPRPRVAYDHRTGPTAPGFRSAQPDMAGFDARVAAADEAMRADAAPDSLATYQQLPFKEDHDMTTEFDSDRNDNWTDRAERQARQTGQRIASTAERLRARIEEGTADMTEAARERVMRARSAAIAAQAEVEAQAANAARYAKRTSHEKPLLVGALAFAAGAAFAAALPRTSTENRLVGGHRDRLMDEADRIYREERGKLKKVARAAVAEGQSVARDALSSDRETPNAGSAVKRVAAAAKSAAAAEDLGKVN